MIKILKERLSIITTLIIGSSSGWSMSSFVNAPEIKGRLISIAIAVSLLVSFMVSIPLKTKLNKQDVKKIIRRLQIVFIAFIFSIIAFFLMYDTYTIATLIAADASDEIVDSNIIVKGIYYTDYARDEIKSLKDSSHIAPDDRKLLADANYHIPDIWPDNSRTISKLIILLIYTTMMALFTYGVCMGTEVVEYFYKRITLPRKRKSRLTNKTLHTKNKRSP